MKHIITISLLVVAAMSSPANEISESQKKWIEVYKKGFFSLQIHAGQKGKVHFRNIKVKELM